MVAVPDWMRANARRGLAWVTDGKGGQGLQPATIREARSLADGTASNQKIRRMAAWFSRHMVDLDAPAATPGADGYPSPGVVAHALWGGGSKTSSQRAMTWAEERVKEMDATSRHWVEGQVEIRAAADGTPVISGYAAVFGQATTIRGGIASYKEVIAPGAFKKTIQEADVRALYNHNENYVLGRSKSGTLKLSEDSIGLKYEVSVPATTWAQDLVESMRRGDVNQSSFAFTPVRQDWQKGSDGEPDQRTLQEVKLYDVSVVTYPAYEQTTSSVRSVTALARATRGQMLDTDDLEALAELRALIDRVAGAPEQSTTPEGPASHPDLWRRRLRLVESLI